MSPDLTATVTTAATTEPPPVPAATIGRRTLWVMAAACGATAANIYYNNPLLDAFARSFDARPKVAALVATAAQVGYGVGMFFLVPLGDLVERRRLILAMTGCCAALLVGMAAAPTVGVLIGLQLLVGAAACGSQILIPLGIDLSPPGRRGHTVGVLMAGLLCGILLARTAAGLVGQHAGWRATYALAAAAMVGVGVVLRAELPPRPPALRMAYPRLLRSMLDLLAGQPTLWTASAVSGLSFAGFTAFWTALSFLMADHFHRGPADAGLFGVVGVAGAAAAPLAGRLSDRGGPRLAVSASLALSAAAFAVMWRWVTVPSLVVGVVLMDAGVQAIQVAEQSTVMALVPGARSRVNTVYMVARFAGGAGGSAVAAVAWERAGWGGVCAAALALIAAAAAAHVAGPGRTRRPATAGGRLDAPPAGS